MGYSREYIEWETQLRRQVRADHIWAFLIYKKVGDVPEHAMVALFRFCFCFSTSLGAGLMGDVPG